jgi:hypothetical protein
MTNIDKIYRRIDAAETCLQNDITPSDFMFFVRLYIKHQFD